jgi:hypothetical protein
MSNNLQQLVAEYMDKLSDIERKACAIAKDHLGSSFNIVKSNGFNDWLKENEKAKKQTKEQVNASNVSTCTAASS